MIERFIDALRSVEGAYALVALTNKKLIGARDPLGIRPLMLGELNGAYILCSETCALDIIGARFVREIENGEVVVISEDGIESHWPFPRQRPGPASSNTSISPSDSAGRSVVMCKKMADNWPVRPGGCGCGVPVPDSALYMVCELNIPFSGHHPQSHWAAPQNTDHPPLGVS